MEPCRSCPRRRQVPEARCGLGFFKLPRKQAAAKPVSSSRMGLRDVFL